MSEPINTNVAAEISNTKWRQTVQFRQVFISSHFDHDKQAYFTVLKLQQLWEEIMTIDCGCWHTETQTGKTEWRDVPVVEEGK